jgi:amidohydrolase
MNLIFSRVEKQKTYIAELRRYFHKYPEHSSREFKTAEKIEAELSALGIPHKRIGETGVLGVIRGGAAGVSGREKVIVLRADIDALHIQEENDVPYRSQNSGIMHACGHDGHTAALLGAAKALMESREAISGEARLAFQQAEEIGAGARQFVAAGVLEGAGRVFGIHMAPDIDTGKIGVTAGPICASVDHFRIVVKGKSAHVSTPQKGADALYAACQIVNALQGIVTRRISPMETVIIGVGKLRAGTAYNIVAEEAVLEGTLRTYTAELREELKNHITGLIGHIAAVSGAGTEIEWKNFTSVLVNDDEACEEAAGIAAAISPGGVIRGLAPSLGGDDFAEFLLAVPGVYVKIGCKKPGAPVIPLHNCRFDIDEDALVYAAGMYASYAAWYLELVP